MNKQSKQKNKSMCLNIKLLFVFLLFFISTFVNANEVDNGLLIVDRKPWKISWIKEKQDWILIAQFEKGTLKTYFREAPPETGFGIFKDKKPLKQEFEFFFGPKFESTKFQYEQWPDGAKAYSFSYETSFNREGQEYEFGTTAIIEEVGNAENEIRYAMYKNSNKIALSPTKKDYSKKNLNEEPKHITELPIHEQIAHKNLIDKLDLINIHRDYIHSQSEALIRLMTLLEDNKDSSGYIEEKRVKKIIDEAGFPNEKKMLTSLNKLKESSDICFKVQYCIDIINKDETKIADWFELLENEILNDINTYENFGMLLPQYKFLLSLYTERKDSLFLQFKMLQLMNPKLFNSTD